MRTASLQRAADMIAGADALLITAGSGLGVDSGLPDFRGNEGFWKAYPPFRERNLSFVDLANPVWFETDPHQAWGFYGHRLHLYRDTKPHQGFSILLRWTTRKDGNYFVFTSNVDGQFQKAGFAEDRITECHGSIHHLQCHHRCSADIWSAAEVLVDVEQTTMRAQDPLPVCPHCGRVARPNILMFGDGQWVEKRTLAQERAYRDWLHEVRGGELVVIECGAGTAVPTVRYASEHAAPQLIRINPREPETPAAGVGLPCGALQALGEIDRLLSP